MQVGAAVGRYRIGRELGRGGMGVVFAARDPGSGREVAIKLLTGLEPEERLRFLDEARALTRIRDPGLAQVLEADLVGANPYLVMDLVPGETLEARLERGPLEPPEAARIALELARTLERLHAAGVVHRDLKPRNAILRPDGRPVLIDLGLALLLDRSARLSRSGDPIGTPAFMPPEQALGRLGEMGPASDVYGLGALLYALLTGRPPFEAATAVGLMVALATSVPAPPSTVRAGIDPRLDRLVLACLAKEPGERPRLADLQSELQRLQVVPLRRPRSPHLPWVGAAAAGLALAGGVAWWLGRAPPPASVPASAPAEAPPTPTGADDLVERGDRAMERGDLEAAASAWDQAIALDPRAIRAWAGRARVRSRLGQHHAAIADWDRVLALDPRDARAHGDRGLARAYLRDFEGAIEDYDRALALEPDEPTTLLNRGLARANLGRHRAAIDDLDRAIALSPGLPGLHAHRGLAWANLGAYEEALQDFDRAVELEPNAREPWLDRAQVLARLGRFEAMIADLDRALALGPGDAAVHLERGVALASLGRPGEALADYDRSLALQPGNARAHSNRGFALMNLGRSQDGLADFDQAISLDPGHARAWFGRGLARATLGLHAQALADLERAAQLDPGADWAADARGQAERLREMLERGR